MVVEFSRTVKTPSAYKSLVEHATELGFEVDEVYFEGCWLTADEMPCWPQASELIGREVGRTYFHVEMDGEHARIKPDDVAGSGEEAKVNVHFKGV